MKNKMVILKRILMFVILIIMVSTITIMSSYVGLELPQWTDMFAMEASAATYSGRCGDNADWSLDTLTGVLEISGSGEMDNYYLYVPWDKYTSYIKSVNISNSVTSIGYRAFYGCTGLTSITIPDSVTSIGGSAFYNCTKLTKVNWNAENVSDFSSDSKVFYNAGTDGSGIDVVFGDNVKSIPTRAFYISYAAYRPKIKSVTIGNSVTSIGSSAFEDCTGLTSVRISDISAWCNIEFKDSTSNPLYYAENLYINGELATSITVPDGVTSIGNSAFYNCTGLTSVTIPDSVTSIGGSAFYNCTRLTKINWNAENVSDFSSDSNVFYNAGTDGSGIDVVFGDNVKSIPTCAFCISNTAYRPKIKSVTIGNSVTSIGGSAFYKCTGLTSVTIPDSVTSIGVSAFYNCTGLTGVTIGNSVTSIGSWAFKYCTRLTKINWNAENVSDFSYDSNVFYNAGTDGSGIDVVFGDNVKSIPAYVFYISDTDNRPKIMSVTIGNSVTSIGYSAFDSCTRLTSVTIGNSVTSIGDYAFYKCTELTKINWNAENVSDFSSDSKVFYNAGTDGSGIDVVFGDNVKSIPAYAFYISYAAHRPKIKSVTIGNSVTSIGVSAFYGCTGLTSVRISDISAWCNIEFKDSTSNPLYYAENLYINGELATSITIPDSVTSIGDYAFYNCAGLTSVIIPDSVTSIGGSAFSFCRSLAQIKFEGNPPALSTYAFEYCNATAYYPYGISEWKSVIKSSYDGIEKWIPYSKASLVYMKIFSSPIKTVYYQGETVDFSGLNLSATWSDGFTATITPDSEFYHVSLSEFSTETPGLKTVTATLDGKSAQFNMGVHEINTFVEARSKYPESTHNYADNLYQTKTYKCPDAKQLVVTFSEQTFVEKDGDYIYVNGTKYTGNTLAGKTITINDDTLTVELDSDEYGNYYGYSIDKIEVTKIKHTYKTDITPATTSADGKIVTACTICDNISNTTPVYKASSIKLSGTSYIYNGKVQKPTVTVKNSKGKTLKNGTDYSVTYSSGCKSTGKYTVKVTFKGNYSGSKTLYFNILPSKTSKLTATQTSASIKATWKAVTGASGYKVTLYTSSGKAVKTVYTTKTSAEFTKLSKGTTYKVRVTAYKTIDGKKVSSTVYTQLTTATKPGTPTLKATPGSKKASLSWNKQTGADGYVVYMSTSKTGKYTKIATVKGNSKVSYTKTGLTKGKTMYFKVAAYKTVDGKTITGSFSAVKSAKIK